jgi:hypothetical protein
VSVGLATVVALHQGLEGVPSSFAAARDGIDAVLRDRGWRRTTPEDTAAALLRGARAGALLAAGTDGCSADDALRVSTMVLGQVAIFRTSPLQALARLHAEAAATMPEDQRGRPRDADAARRLQWLGRLLVDPTPAPALLVAAVVHAEIAAGAPFGSHNRVVALAAERLTLVARGVDRASVLVPEAGHLDLRSAYEAALSAYGAGGGLGGGSSRPEGIELWLRYAPSAYLKGAEASPLHANGTQWEPGAAAHT